MTGILITRPEDDAEEFAALARTMGFEPVCEPMLEIRPIKAKIPDLKRFQGMVFTSVNGLRRFCEVSKERGLRAYCVGDTTASRAVDFGFKDVHSAGGNARDLARLIRERAQPGKPLLHARGVHTAVSIREEVAPEMPVEEAVLYEAVPTQSFSEETLSRLDLGELDAVLFFSVRTGEAFVRLILAAGRTDSVKNILALCLSQSVLECVSVLPWKAVYAAERADRRGMIDLLSRLEVFKNRLEHTGETMSANADPLALNNAEEIIERFGGIRPMASKIDVPVTTVQGWKKRNVIPGARRDQIVAAAQNLNINIADILQANPVANENNIIPEVSSQPVSAEVDVMTKPEMPAPRKIRAEALAENKPVPFAASMEEPKRAYPQNEVDAMDSLEFLQRRTVRTSLLVTTGVVASVIAVGAFLLWPSAQQFAQQGEQITVLEQKVDGVASQVQGIDNEVKDLNMRSDFLKGVVPADMQKRVADMENQAANLQNTLQQMATRADELSAGVLGPDAGSVNDRLAKIEQEIAAISGSGQMTDLLTRIRGLETTVAGQQQFTAAVEELKASVSATDGRVGALEQQVQGAQAQGTPLGQTLQGVTSADLKAAVMLIAFAQLRDSLNRQGPFDQDLALLQNVVGTDDPELQVALRRLAPHAQDGILTQEGLSRELQSLAGEIALASLQGEDISLKERIKARIGEIFRVEKDGELVSGNDAQSKVARAQTLLDQGDIEGAISQLQTLNGPAAQAAQPFIDEAQITLLARQTQDLVQRTIVGSINRSITAGSAPINLDEAVRQQPTQGVAPAAEQAAPVQGQQVIRDRDSGAVILPGEDRFKGFSDSQP